MACRGAFVPIHASFGTTIFMLAVATCLTGLTQKSSKLYKYVFVNDYFRNVYLFQTMHRSKLDFLSEAFKLENVDEFYVPKVPKFVFVFQFNIIV